jgi:7,8-dihydroneopterin aldolase/epimerase/oxygenase
VDKIFLRQLAVSALIGVYDHEKITPQVIYLDVEASVDADKAAATDLLNATLDYAEIYHCLREYISATRFQLLETLAVNVSNLLITRFSLTWLRLTITKKPADLPDISGAGIIIERERA